MDARTVRTSLALLTLTACRAHDPPRQVPYNVTVSIGTDLTVLRGSFTDPSSLAWSSPDCIGIRLHDNAEPASLPAGRINVWTPFGAVIGHVDPRPGGVYQAQVRGALPPGTHVAAAIQGSSAVPAHRFRTAPTVPARVRRLAPEGGMTLHPGAPLRVAWEGGDSSHVAVLLLAAHGSPDTAAEAWMVSCVVPRAPGGFTVPAAALARAYLPSGADTWSVAVTADNRVVEDDFALDVTPVATPDDVVTGTVGN